MGQRGFGLVEVVVAAGAFAVVAGAFVFLLSHLIHGAATLATASNARLDATALLHKLDDDAQSAEAIFVPALDVRGADNATTPHEVDFYAYDSAATPFFWAYYFDGSSVQQYRYARGETATATGPRYEGISGFRPAWHHAGDVAVPGSAVFMPLFASAVDREVRIGQPGLVPGGGPLLAGSPIVHVAVQTSHDALVADLVTATAPSGFTVVASYTPAPTASTAPTVVHLHVVDGKCKSVFNGGEVDVECRGTIDVSHGAACDANAIILTDNIGTGVVIASQDSDVPLASTPEGAAAWSSALLSVVNGVVQQYAFYLSNEIGPTLTLSGCP